MNAIDIFILIVLLIGGLNGLRQGFVKAFANLIGWILALIVGAKFASVLAPSMVSLSEDPVVQKIAAFAFIVLVIVVLTWIVTALLNNILKSLKLGPLNRLAGGAFGSLKGLLIVLITMQGLGLKALHTGDNPNLSKHFCLTRLGRWSFLKRLQARRCHISSLKIHMYLQILHRKFPRKMLRDRVSQQIILFINPSLSARLLCVE